MNNRQSKNLIRSNKINPALVYLSTLAPSGQRTMYCQLKTAIKVWGSNLSVEEYDWGAINYAKLLEIRAHLVEQQKSTSSINCCMAAVKGVAQCAFHLRVINAETLLHIKSVKRVSGNTTPAGRSLAIREFHRLLRTCRKDTCLAGIRDFALLSVMLTTGLRRAEVCGLMFDNYNSKTGLLTVAKTKGGKDRICLLPTQVRQQLEKWIGKRGEVSGALFCRIRKNQMVQIQPLSTQALYDIVQKRADEAKLGKVTPHDLRRTFVTRLLDAKVDINTVRQLVGHSDISTTSRYDLRTPNARKIIEKIIY